MCLFSKFLDWIFNNEDEECLVQPLASRQQSDPESIPEAVVIGVPLRPSGTIDESKPIPVHTAIQMFDRPNEIETSLPRYQQKKPTIVTGNSSACRVQRIERKVDELKKILGSRINEHLERQKCIAFSTAMRRDPPGCEETNNWTKELTDRSCSELIEAQVVTPKSFPVVKGVPKPGHLMASVMELQLTEASGIAYMEKNVEWQMTPLPALMPPGYGGGWPCHRCHRIVYHAERMLACGNAYHATCFSCVRCRKFLGPMTYLEADCEIFCKQCHAKNIGPKGYGFGLGGGVLQTS